MQSLADRVIHGAIDFLLKNQGDDGMWRDFMTPAGEASSWPTGFVLAALRATGVDHVKLSHSTQALIERQQPDGGWGYNEDTPSDADSTAWVLLALSAGPFEFSDARAAACLRRHRRRNGGIATYASAGPIRRYTMLPRWLPFRGWCGASVEVSATATRALRAVQPSALHDAGWRYIQSRQRRDGSWGAYWWTTPHVATQQAVILGATLGRTGTIERAAAWAVRIFEPDGPPFHIALCLSIVATASPWDIDTINRLVDTLHHLQRADGSWQSVPILRVPLPADTADSDHRGWRFIRFAGGLEVADQHRSFTTATCLTALVQAGDALSSTNG